MVAGASGDTFKLLNESIKKAYNGDVQTKRIWDVKQQAIRVLEEVAKNTQFGRDYDLKIWLTGSSVNGFGNKNSDADMCLVTYSQIPLNRKQIVNLLHAMRRQLQGRRDCRNCEVIPAKVPILRVFLDLQVEKSSGFKEVQCDINVDNHIGIRNSWLLRCYSELDPRIREFIYVVKKFAKGAQINDASSGSLSTYSWLLLSIHFLQSGVKPAVLPIVQQIKNTKTKKLYHEHFAHDELEEVSRIALEVKGLIKFKSDNTMSVGELFQRWLTYYAHSFNFSDWIITIRMGKVMMRHGRGSLSKLETAIKESEASMSKTEANSRGPRKTSGMFVKKKAKGGNDDSQSDGEEKGSIVKLSSDEEGSVSSDDGFGMLEDEGNFQRAVEIFGSEECAAIIHPRYLLKKQAAERPAAAQSDSYKSLSDKELVLEQRKCIRDAATDKIHFKESDYPQDRIVICIEEPFQKDNVARAVYDKEKAIKIVRTLRYCRERFEEARERGQTLNLDTISRITGDYARAKGQEIHDTINGKRRKRSHDNTDTIFVDEDSSSDDDTSAPAAKRQKKNGWKAKSVSNLSKAGKGGKNSPKRGGRGGSFRGKKRKSL